jgi:hypothetical protein
LSPNEQGRPRLEREALDNLETWFFPVVELTRYNDDSVMRTRIRFLWNATKGHRFAPWRSPYLLWRIETYTGVKMKQIGFLEFWEFMWRERTELWRFLRWTGEMDRWVHPKPKNP